MKISLSISLILFLLPLETFCQTLNDQSIAYLTLENETEKCMDNWLDTNQVGWEELSHVFERYFIDAGITDSSDSIAKQYLDILSFWNHPSKSFPAFKQREVIRSAQKKLNLSDENLKSYLQLSCLVENYRQNKSKLDPASSFHVFGETLETVHTFGRVSPGLMAGALKFSMKQKDLEKPLYQKAIVLMFCFDMARFL